MAIHVLPWTDRVTLDSKVEARPDMVLLDITLLFSLCRLKYEYTLKMMVLAVILTHFPLPGMIKTVDFSKYDTEYDNTLFAANSRLRLDHCIM